MSPNCPWFRFTEEDGAGGGPQLTVTLHSHHTERWLVPSLMILVLLIIAVVLIRIWF